MKPYINTWPEIPKSAQAWRKNRDQYNRLIIEIGAGAGYHGVQYATQHPDDFIITIERTLEKARKMLRRREKHPHLKNWLPIHADATVWIAQNCAVCEVDAFYILYPNPYPKASQANKRFFNMPFMEKLLACLKPSGRIILATNCPDYCEESVAMAKGYWQLEIVSQRILPESFSARTHFEKKYLARADVCHEAVFKKAVH